MNNNKTIDIKPLPGYVLIKNIDYHDGCIIGIVATIGNVDMRHFFKKNDIVFFEESRGVRVGTEQHAESGLVQYLVREEDIFATASGELKCDSGGVWNVVLY